MWRMQAFKGNELMIEHAQRDYGQVFRFTVNALVELNNQQVQDFRVIITNKRGDVYFFVCGEKTQLANFRKGRDLVPTEHQEKEG